jgi:hypothetical protein
MDLSVMMKKKHLLLLNRIMRTELKKDLIMTPSKLTEGEVNDLFKKLFVKKDDYYVPIKAKVELNIDEELFKQLNKPKVIKTKEDKTKMKEETQAVGTMNYYRDTRSTTGMFEELTEKLLKAVNLGVSFELFDEGDDKRAIRFFVTYEEKKYRKNGIKNDYLLMYSCNGLDILFIMATNWQ